MSRYLDPKSDVVFKKIFGEHPHLLMSFLNAVLPLPEDCPIVDLLYLPSEQVPVIPEFKRTLVDVKCCDQQGRVFIVEMQVEWGTCFMQRLLFGTAQAYVKQLKPGEHYSLLNPVYGLGLINGVFNKDSSAWYHHYGLVKLDNPTQEIINGLSLVFLELPKFKAATPAQKKLQVLWLRFMRELDTQTRVVDPALLAVPEIKEAVALAEEAAYTPGELELYEGYWKQVSSEKSLMFESMDKGKQLGLSEGKKLGIKVAHKEVAKKMKQAGMTAAVIARLTELSVEEIDIL